MFPLKFDMKDISVGSCLFIGRSNIEEFLNHVNGLSNFNEKPLVELINSYETAIASLVGMIEARFVNLNPILKQMFLKLKDMEDSDDKNFVRKTLLMEFNDVAREARKIFAYYNMVGYGLNIVHTLKTLDIKTNDYVGKTKGEKEVKIPIPFKLLGTADTLEDNFGWIAPQNLFDESSQPKRKERGDSQPWIGWIQCIYDKFSSLSLEDDDDLDFKKTCYLALRLAKRR